MCPERPAVDFTLRVDGDSLRPVSFPAVHEHELLCVIRDPEMIEVISADRFQRFKVKFAVGVFPQHHTRPVPEIDPDACFICSGCAGHMHRLPFPDMGRFKLDAVLILRDFHRFPAAIITQPHILDQGGGSIRQMLGWQDVVHPPGQRIPCIAHSVSVFSSSAASSIARTRNP